MTNQQTATTLHRSLQLDRGTVICLVGAGGKTSLMFRLARELAAEGRVLATTTTKISTLEASRNEFDIILGAASALVKRAGERREDRFCVTAARNRDAGKLAGFEASDLDFIWQSGAFDWIIVEADGASRRPLKVPDLHEPVIPDCCHCVVGLAGLTALGNPLTDQWVFRLPLFTSLTGLAPGDPITAAAVARSINHPEGIFKNAPHHARQIAFLNQAESPVCLEAGRQVVAVLAGQDPAIRLDRAILGQLRFDPPVIETFDF